jgi:uncharacterized protein (TIGR02594 family)
MVFVSARAPAPKIVIYKDDTGAEFVREGGSRAWRNFNPGNIEKGSFADEQGSIGADTRFAIFPSEAVGLAAVIALLSGPSYRDLTLEKAINRYAPPSENNTAGYVASVAKGTGLKKSVVLSTLARADLEGIAKAIQKIEGWILGKEYPNQPFVTLAGALSTPVSSAAVAATDWMQVASTEASRPEHERSEWADPGENPRILEYFRIAAPWFDAKTLGGDEVDWCAAFVNYCLETAGYPGTGHPGARSFFWNKDKHFLMLEGPKYGCIAVFRDAPFTDAEWKTGTGHVGFVVDWSDKTVDLLGGNQGKTVKRQTYEQVQQSGIKVTRKIVAFAMPVMN